MPKKFVDSEIDAKQEPIINSHTSPVSSASEAELGLSLSSIQSPWSYQTPNVKDLLANQSKEAIIQDSIINTKEDK